MMNNKIIQILRAIRNPEQAKQLAMQGLQKNNPQIANILQDCLNRGETPKQILTQAIEAGKINYSQFQQFKGLINQYSRFLPFQISQAELNELESAFNHTNNTSGFRF